jgi:thiol-disulfide isomerase/thioredoxin
LASANKYPTVQNGADNFKSQYCTNFLDNPYLYHSATLYSGVLPGKYFEYLTSCTTFDEAGFKKSIDNLLEKTRTNPKIYDYTLYYLLELFESVGPEIIFQYIVKEYVLKNACTDDTDGLPAQITDKIKALQNLLPGNQAPSVILPDKISLNFTSTSSSTLLVFWSSYCPFCNDLLSQLSTMKLENVQIIGISLDTEKDEYENYLNTSKLKFTSYCDFAGWDNVNVKTYAVSKTPLMVLVDDKGLIVKYDIQPKEILKLLE